MADNYTEQTSQALQMVINLQILNFFVYIRDVHEMLKSETKIRPRY